MPLDSFAAMGEDPLTALADAMDAAVGVARDQADRARATIGDFVPAAGRFLSRVVYRASYVVSFGVAFPAVLFASAIPTGNAVVHGLIDGARAARVALQERKAGAGPEPDPDDR
jgi:hypothetical protein